MRAQSLGFLLSIAVVWLVRIDGRPASQRELRDLGLEFNCPTIPPPNRTATSVHKLHAADIKVIMAMGDSVTAGFAMMGRLGIMKDLTEFRSQSWLIGAGDSAQTLATFFRNYNPRLIGGSTGDHLGEFCWGNICPASHDPEKDVLNAAQSGAMMYDFVRGRGNQVQYLFDQLQAKKDIIDIDNDWKLLSIFVGANDMCVQCEEVNIEPTSPDDYEKYFRESMLYLKAKVPRLMVHVGLLFNISQMYQLSLNVSDCEDIHRILPEECMCAFKYGPEGDKHRKMMDLTAVEYNKRLLKVAAEFRANGSDTFTIVPQPAFKDGTLDNFPLTFISRLDCFHPSLEAHQLMAKVFWNGIWTPRAQKTTHFDYKAPFVCPTSESTIPTD